MTKYAFKHAGKHYEIADIETAATRYPHIVKATTAYDVDKAGLVGAMSLGFPVDFCKEVAAPGKEAEPAPVVEPVKIENAAIAGKAKRAA